MPRAGLEEPLRQPVLEIHAEHRGDQRGGRALSRPGQGGGHAGEPQPTRLVFAQPLGLRRRCVPLVLAEAGLDDGAFGGPLFLASPPVELGWHDRFRRNADVWTVRQNTSPIPATRRVLDKTGMTIDLLTKGYVAIEVPCDLRHRASSNDLKGQLHRAAQYRDVLLAVALGATIYVASVAKSARGVANAEAHYPSVARRHSLPVSSWLDAVPAGPRPTWSLIWRRAMWHCRLQ